MLTLLKNEFIKLFKKPKTRGLLILFFIAVAGCLFIAQREAANWEKSVMDIDGQIRSAEANIKYAKERIEESEEEIKRATDKTTIANYKRNIEYCKEDLASYKKSLEELKKEKVNPTPWQKKVEKEIKDANTEIVEMKKQLKDLDAMKGMKQRDKEFQKKELERGIAWNEESIVKSKNALEIDVEPLWGSEFEAGTLIMNCSMILSLAIPLFIAIFGSDIVSDEATNETFKFLLIQPVRRSKILWAKFITLLTTTIGLIMGTQIAIFLVVGATKGFEHLKLIYKVGTKFEYHPVKLEGGIESVIEILNTGYHITLGEYVGQIFLFQTLFIIASCALVFMISTVCKSNMISMAVATVVLVGGSILPMFIETVAKSAHLTFLGYNNPMAVIGGEIAYMYTNISYSNELGIILMAVSTVVFLAIAQINFSKKDILV